MAQHESHEQPDETDATTEADNESPRPANGASEQHPQETKKKTLTSQARHQEYATEWTKARWKSLSAKEQEAEKEKAVEQAREQFLDSDLCSDVPQAVFQGFIHQSLTGTSERHSATFIYEGSIQMISAALAANLESKSAAKFVVDTAKGPRASTRSATVDVKFPGGMIQRNTTFRIIEGLKHDRHCARHTLQGRYSNDDLLR